VAILKRKYLRAAGFGVAGVTLLTLFGAYALACSFVYMAPSLPSVEAMRKVEMQVPLRVFTASGELIAQIGEQRRIPVTYEQIPPLVRQAFLAAEDDAFFQHSGVDYLGILRAVLVNLVSAEKAQGASTITQQAARNMFLTLDKTWRRKLAELFVTWRMEREFSKQEILGLYLNVIYFGQRSYGVAAASEAFFGKPLDELSVSEVATLAGVPQAPSRYNPITNQENAGAVRSSAR
jgi:penicillin-binding protein 1A